MLPEVSLSKVAVVQMVSGADYQANLAEAALLIRQAADQGAQLVLLPENFAVFHASLYLERGESEQQSTGPIRAFLAEQALHHQVCIIGGSIPVLAASGERVRSACFVFDENGHELTRYDKVHLFDVDVADAQASYRESDQIEPGSALRVVDTSVGKVGLSICYDLRFPALYQSLMMQGAQIITVPAAFTKTTGEAHWHILLRARAIETQCYVLAANQGGQHSSKRATYGHSLIVDPWGRVLAEKVSEGSGVVVADIDLQLLEDIRQKMPIIEHSRKV